LSRRPARNKKKKSLLGSGIASKLFLCPYCDKSAYNLGNVYNNNLCDTMRSVL